MSFKKVIYKFLKNWNFFFVSKKIKIDLNIPELPFVVLITSYNNEKYCQRNIESVLAQNYSNYEIIYVDDFSTDQTASLVENIFSKELKIKTNLIKNDQRKRKLANLYETIEKIPNEKIIVELDGDDYFIDNNVLKTLNTVYQKNKSWLVYCNYKNNPETLAKKLKLKTFSQSTPKFVIKRKLFRAFPWIYSGLRTYYAGLFKKISKEVLISKITGDFFPVSHDAVIFYPMLEMAGDKISYISKSMLLRNIDSPINDFKSYDDLYRKEIWKEICNAQKYDSIETIF